jgi:hypothetical protein
MWGQNNLLEGRTLGLDLPPSIYDKKALTTVVNIIILLN